jgi:hypothetical protein
VNRKASTPKKKPVPNETCPQLASLAPFITEKAKRLAAARLGMTDEKVALLIVKAINPYAILSQEEEALLRGVTAKTLRGLHADKLVRRA